MKTFRFVLIVLLTLSLSTVAMAQDGDPIVDDEFGVTVSPPSAWDVLTDDDGAVANFKHDESQSQIQVIATPLMNDEVADVFFDTFHSTLAESDFSEVSREEESIGGFEGTSVTYEFTHSGVTLAIKVFEFMHDDTAWLTIGYMEDAESEENSDAYFSVIENLSFENGE